MCLIAFVPSGTADTLSATIITTAMQRHPDGFGLAWREQVDGKPALRTASFAPADKAEFRAMLDAVQKGGDEFAVHFRFATSGPKTAEQAHPYTYEDPDPEVGTVAVLHNGIIGIQHDRAVESDTSAFVRLVLARLPSRWWAEPAHVYLVREAMGYSKFSIMTATESVIIGEEMGEWDGGVWFSSEHRPMSAYGWTPASRKASQMAPTPGSKRSAKRAAAAARREAAKVRKPDLSIVPVVSAVTGDDAYIPDVGMRGGLAGYPSLSHGGHRLEAVKPVDRRRDNDYVNGVRCTECDTLGDLYVIDGTCYADMAHLAPTGLQLAVEGAV